MEKRICSFAKNFFMGWISFSAICTGFSIFNTLKMQKLKQDFTCIYDDGANHLIKGEAVGGWIFLSEKGKSFRSICIKLCNDNSE